MPEAADAPVARDPEVAESVVVAPAPTSASAPAPLDAAAQAAKERAELQSRVDYTVLSPLAYRAVFASIMVLCFMVGLDITIVVTAMPKIAKQFDSLSTISWAITAFLLAQTAVSPLVGRLSELLGRRTILLFAIFTFTAFSLACALSTSFAQLALFRGLQGVGGGIVMPSVMIVISDITAPATRGTAMAPIMATFTLSSIIGPVLGGALTDISEGGWRVCFWINVPIGVVAFAIIFLCIPKTLGDQAAKFDAQREAAGVKSGSAARAAAPQPRRCGGAAARCQVWHLLFRTRTCAAVLSNCACPLDPCPNHTLATAALSPSTRDRAPCFFT
jgi:MFS family permease